MAEEKTLEEQLKEALEQVKQLTETNKKQKEAIDNACADASKQKQAAKDWQDKYKATLSEQEKKDLETKQAQDELEKQLAEYKAKDRVSTYTAKLMAVGYDAETAAKMAVSLPDGVADDFFTSQKTFLEAKTQEIKSQTLNTQPGLSTGLPSSSQQTEDKEMADLRRWMGVK